VKAGLIKASKEVFEMTMVQNCLDGRPRLVKMGAEGEVIPMACTNQESVGKSRIKGGGTLIRSCNPLSDKLP
jgi:hypothetical protein